MEYGIQDTDRRNAFKPFTAYITFDSRDDVRFVSAFLESMDTESVFEKMCPLTYGELRRTNYDLYKAVRAMCALGRMIARRGADRNE